MVTHARSVDVIERKSPGKVKISYLALLSALSQINEGLSSSDFVTTGVGESFASEHSLHRVVAETKEWFQFNSISVYLLHDESDEFRLEVSFPEGPTFGTDVDSFQRGEGILGRVAETGESINFANVHTDPRPAEFRQRDVCSESPPGFLAIFPIKTRFKVWGVLVCGGQTPRQLNGGELDLMNAICHQIAMAVENDALLNRIGAKGKEIAALYSIAGIASEFLDVNAVLKKVLYKLLQIFQFDAARIYVRDRVGGDLRLVAQEGFAEEPSLPPSFRFAEGPVGHAFQTGETLIFEDLQEDAGSHRLTREDNILRAGFRGAVFVPIRVRGENLGVLNLLSRAVHPFPPSDIQLLNSIAYHLGIAVGNATLLSQLKKKTSELEKANQELRGREQVQELLKELGQDMISLDISDLLRKLTERVRQFLGTDIADVRLFEGEGWHLRALSGVEPERIPLPWSQSTSTRRRSVWIREHRKPLRVSDITQGEMKSSGHVLESAGIRGYLGVPIQARGGEVLGILRALSREPREFTREEVDLLMQLANGTAIVLDNARLLAQVKQQAVDLQKANKGKDEFLSVVSHELRTPLNVIMGFTGLMRDEMLGELKPEQQNAVEAIHRQSESLLSMVSSILQATKIDAEAIRAERQEFPLPEFLDKLKVSCELLCAKERVVVRWDYPVELPFMESDEEMCRHILHNLIDNAVKFTEQGEVRISARYDSHADIVEFEVADTGIGIIHEELPIIFEKFRQVDSSETRRYDGAGLGLYIVKKYTDILGGEIRVASRPGLGSTFSVTLPRRLNLVSITSGRVGGFTSTN